MNNIPNVYVGATRQNDGKTTTVLGLLNAFQEHFPHVGYIKPVGQQISSVDGYHIDRDATLIEEIFHIGGELPDMSPIAVPRGFTENFILNGNVTTLNTKISDSYDRASRDKQFMVIDGTGHAGVGAVLDLPNAAVAKLLNAPVVIVTCGGIGRPIDEVMLNKAVFDSYGVPVIGVIVNKVIPEKYDRIEKYVRLGFERKGIDVLGVLPFCPMLSSPTISQLLEDSKGTLLCGEKNIDQTVSRIVVGAMPPHTALDHFKGEVLLITPGNRDDLILAAASVSNHEDYSIQGVILTDGLQPHKTVLDILCRSEIPVILVVNDTFSMAERITKLIIKIRASDRDKINMVKQLIKEYIDIETLIKKLRNAKRGA